MLSEYIDKGIYRLKVPFEDIFTTVYGVLGRDGELMLIDSATYPEDFEEYILPFIKELGGGRADYLLLSHSHSDHAGGAKALSEALPKVKIGASFETGFENGFLLKDGDVFLNRLAAVFLPGHSKNSFGFFDLETKTLLSADCLQLKGIGKYRSGIGYPLLYKSSIEKLKTMDIERIVAAHEYDPLGSMAVGKEAVKAYLDACLEEVKKYF